jgi:hypothetical protein
LSTRRSPNFAETRGFFVATGGVIPGSVLSVSSIGLPIVPAPFNRRQRGAWSSVLVGVHFPHEQPGKGEAKMMKIKLLAAIAVAVLALPAVAQNHAEPRPSHGASSGELTAKDCKKFAKGQDKQGRKASKPKRDAEVSMPAQ